MKQLAIISTFCLFTAVAGHAAQIGTLLSNHSYKVLLDGTLQTTVVATNSLATIELPQGNHTIQLVDLGPLPTPTPTQTSVPSPTPTPTEEIVDPPTPTPSPTQAPNPTPVDSGLDVFVASFSEETHKNRFQVLDLAGKSLTPYTEVLSGVETEGQMEVSDLDGDSKKEIVAFGASQSGILLEYWSGEGQLLQSRNVLSVWHNFDNHLLTCDFDGYPGEEVVVLGRNQSGIYRFEAYDAEGNELVTFPSIVPGYRTIQDIAVDDVDGDGACEVVLFGRTGEERTEAMVIGLEGVEDPITIFGKGYSEQGSGFTVDLDGDGVAEIGAVARRGNSSFRLIVVDVYGQIRLKKNVFSSKFEDRVQACSADVNGDSAPEIVVSGRLADTGENIVQVFDSEGYQVVAHSYLDSGFKGETINLFSDIDKDGSVEFVVAGRDSLTGTAAYQVFRGGESEMLYGGFLFENEIENDPKVLTEDLDRDGVEELLVSGTLATGVHAVELREVDSGELTFQTTFSTKILKVAAGVLN